MLPIVSSIYYCIACGRANTYLTCICVHCYCAGYAGSGAGIGGGHAPLLPVTTAPHSAGIQQGGGPPAAPISNTAHPASAPQVMGGAAAGAVAGGGAEHSVLAGGAGAVQGSSVSSTGQLHMPAQVASGSAQQAGGGQAATSTGVQSGVGHSSGEGSATSAAAAKLSGGGLRGNWGALWHALAMDHYHAGLIWNEATRAELRGALAREEAALRWAWLDYYS
eukprot:283487-Pelagomonas_calceolata.AAC.1